MPKAQVKEREKGDKIWLTRVKKGPEHSGPCIPCFGI